MQNKPIYKQAVLFASIAAATAAYAANPTEETGELTIPITVTGEIQEVVACEFYGGAASGLTFDFSTTDPAATNQYTSDGDATLTIDCSNGANGSTYAVAMDVADDGTTSTYATRRDAITVDVGTSTGLTALLTASQDGAAAQPIKDDFTGVASGDSSEFAFTATIQSPDGATGTVTASSTPKLYVAFDASGNFTDLASSSPGTPRPVLGLEPLGESDDGAVSEVNRVLNTINGDSGASGELDPVYAEITSANTGVNSALSTTPTGIPAEQSPFSDLDENSPGSGNGDGELNEKDLPGQ